MNIITILRSFKNTFTFSTIAILILFVLSLIIWGKSILDFNESNKVNFLTFIYLAGVLISPALIITVPIDIYNSFKLSKKLKEQNIKYWVFVGKAASDRKYIYSQIKED